MDRSDVIDRARRAYEEVGRGVIVMLLEDAELRYVPDEEMKASLAEAQVEPELLFGVAYAIRKHDTRWGPFTSWSSTAVEFGLTTSR